MAVKWVERLGVAFMWAALIPCAGAQDEQPGGATLNGQDQAPAPSTATESPWRHLKDRRWYDGSAFAGASYQFFEDEDGRPRAKHTVFGSGVPVISEEIVEVEIKTGLIWLPAGSVQTRDPAAPLEKKPFRYEQRADVLRRVGSCGVRLVPYDNATGFPVESPLLKALGVAPDDALKQALSNPDPLVRREAIVIHTYARRHTYRAGFPEVLQLLEESNAELRAYAAWAAGQCQEEAAVPLLLANLISKDVDLRRESAGALGWGRLGGEAAIQPLRDLLDGETDPGVRGYAERSLEILTGDR